MINLTQMTPLFTKLPQSVLEMEITPPEAPATAAEVMPETTGDFWRSCLELTENVLLKLRPDLSELMDLCLSIVICVILLSLLNAVCTKGKRIATVIGTLVISSILLTNTQSMTGMASDTIDQLSAYGKLLFPVMTAAVAAQGGVTTSAALYAGTAAFDAVLSNMISELLVPMVFLFLALAVGHSATGEECLKRFLDILKNIISWILRLIIIVFTTYMSITGVVSGTTDAVALKAAKVTISTVVPVVGGILSDASEAVLVGAGLMKNSAGLYGMIVVLALFLEPFLKIGVHYLMLKLTSAVCGMIGSKEITGLIENFGTAMGLLLAMTGSVCLLLMISVICFLKGVG